MVIYVSCEQVKIILGNDPQQLDVHNRVRYLIGAKEEIGQFFLFILSHKVNGNEQGSYIHALTNTFHLSIYSSIKDLKLHPLLQKECSHVC